MISASPSPAGLDRSPAARRSPSSQLLRKFSAGPDLPPSAAPLRAGPNLELRGARPGSTLRRPARRRRAAAGKPYELSRKGVTKGPAGRGPESPVPFGGARGQQSRGALEDECAASGNLYTVMPACKSPPSSQPIAPSSVSP